MSVLWFVAATASSKTSPEVSGFIKKQQIVVKFLPMPALDVHSRRIRQFLSEGQLDAEELKSMLSKKVLSFLQSKAASKA